MKAGWQRKTIGEVCDVVNGSTPKTGVTAYCDGLHQWITPAEMGKRSTPYIAKTERAITDAGLQNSSARLLPPQSVILSSRAPIGHLVINTAPMATNQGCKGLVPRNGLDAKYLYYYLAGIVPLLNDLGAGATFKELSGGRLKEVPVPVAPLPEQHRIVAILDEAFDGIATAKANAEKNLQNARALFESHLQSVFTERGEGWRAKALGEMAVFRNGINFTKTSKGAPIKILGVKNFQSNHWAPLVDLDSIIPDGVIPDLDTLQEYDIVFVRSNGNPELIGRCLLIGKVSERTTHSGFTIKARLQTSELLPNYLCHFLKSGRARREMIDGGNGVNIKSLNQGTLSRIVIPFPSLADQAQIVQRLEHMQGETQRLESVYQQKLTALNALKKSLLHQAFSGAL